MLAAYSNSNQTNWDLYLPLVLFAYRTSQHASTGESPFYLLYGREPRLNDLDNYNIGYETSDFIRNIHENWLCAKANLVKQGIINKKYYDSKNKIKQNSYKIGDQVRIKQPQTKIGLKKKLRNDLWSDPFEVTRVISNQNIEVKLRNNKIKIININNVKKFEGTIVKNNNNNNKISNNKNKNNKKLNNKNNRNINNRNFNNRDFDNRNFDNNKFDIKNKKKRLISDENQYRTSNYITRFGRVVKRLT